VAKFIGPLSYNARMTASASAPRIRLTRLIYLLVLAAAALSEGRAIQDDAGLLAQAAGFVLVVAAVLGRLWTTLFIAGRKETELVREGPYSVCRHPLYLCSVIASLGIALTTRSVTLTVGLPVLIGVVAGIAARREDHALSLAHRDDWSRYRDAVPGFRPAWSRHRMPDRVSVPPAIYRKAFLDAASFLALWLAVLLLETLRTGGAWPALFRLP
jgi:protein-S-isoprenylcysteine O-methyltransferase Ste14